MTDLTEGKMEPGCRSRLRHAEALRREAEALLEQGHVHEALSAFASVVAEFADSEDQDVRAEAELAGYKQAHTLTEIGRHADALAAIAGSEASIAAPGATLTAAKRAMVKARALTGLDRADDALATYADVVVRFGSSSSDEVLACVANALNWRGYLLSARGDEAGAIEAYDECVRRFGQAREAELREEVALALVSGAHARCAIGELGEALDCLARYFAEFADASSAPRHMSALLTYGRCLRSLGRADEAVRAYEDVVAYSHGAGAGAARAKMARVRLVQMELLDELGRSAEGISIADEALEEFGADRDEEIRRTLGWMMCRKARLLERRGDPAHALAAYDEALLRLEQSTVAGDAAYVAIALDQRSAALSALGRDREALASLDELLARFGTETDDAVVRGRVLRALVRKASMLGRMGRPQEASLIERALLDRLDEPADAESLAMLGRALLGHAVNLVSDGRTGAALELYDRMVEAFDSAEDSVRGYAVLALTNKAQILGSSGHEGDADELFHDVVARFGEVAVCAYDDVIGRAGEADERGEIPSMLYLKGMALLVLGRDTDAAESFRELVRAFARDERPQVRCLVGAAREQLEALAGD
ncbi:MAG TPA: tetratricopeptide repeat protein [Baekduia sp.]|nr:tetratricopeptide repeat protein [Baekduia sp.]